MQLKEYQRRALETIRSYLELLADWRKKAKDNPDLERNQERAYRRLLL